MKIARILENQMNCFFSDSFFHLSPMESDPNFNKVQYYNESSSDLTSNQVHMGSSPRYSPIVHEMKENENQEYNEVNELQNFQVEDSAASRWNKHPPERSASVSSQRSVSPKKSSRFDFLDLTISPSTVKEPKHKRQRETLNLLQDVILKQEEPIKRPRYENDSKRFATPSPRTLPQTVTPTVSPSPNQSRPMKPPSVLGTLGSNRQIESAPKLIGEIEKNFNELKITTEGKKENVIDLQTELSMWTERYVNYFLKYIKIIYISRLVVNDIHLGGSKSGAGKLLEIMTLIQRVRLVNILYSF